MLFPAGNPPGATQGVVVSLLADTLDETDNVIVDLSSANGASIGLYGRTTVTIVDDDPTPTLSVNDTGVVEGNSGSVPLVFTVSLSAASGRSVSVNYATTPNTATAGIDFTSVSGTLTFAPGVVTQTVSVWVVPDVTDEPDEGMFVDLTGPTGATVPDARARGVIHDDDPTSQPPTRDFNSDGWADLVWRNRVTGYNALWYMTGNTLLSTTSFLPTGAGGAEPLAGHHLGDPGGRRLQQRRET